MKRAFLTTFLALVSLAAFAQQRKDVPRIGVLGNTVGSPNYAAFVRALRDLGYVEGRNIAFEWRWAEGRADHFSDLASDLVRSKVDLIVTTGTQSSLAAKQATTTIPIVMAISSFPDKVGLVDSLAQRFFESNRGLREAMELLAGGKE